MHTSLSRGDRELSEHLTPEESRDPPVGGKCEASFIPQAGRSP